MAITYEWINTANLAGALFVNALHSIDGILYAGTRPNGNVFKYDVGTDTWANTGDLAGAAHVLSLYDISGVLYAGTYPNGNVFKYDVGTDTWANTGDLAGASYVYALHSIDGILYAGTRPNGDVFVLETTISKTSTIGVDIQGTKTSTIGVDIQGTKTSTIGVDIQETKTKTSTIGVDIQETKTKTSTIGVDIQETKTKESSLGITIKGLIHGSYTDMQKCKSYLTLSLFDLSTLDEEIIIQSENAKDKINTFLRRTIDFTVTELGKTQFAGIVDSASQLTACLVQQTPQAAAANYTEDTVTDCEEAYKTLTNWAINNGIPIPGTETELKSILTELVYVMNDTTGVI